MDSSFKKNKYMVLKKVINPELAKFVTDYFNRRKQGKVTGVDRGLSEAELFEAGTAIESAANVIDTFSSSRSSTIHHLLVDP